MPGTRRRALKGKPTISKTQSRRLVEKQRESGARPTTYGDYNAQQLEYAIQLKVDNPKFTYAKCITKTHKKYSIQGVAQMKLSTSTLQRHVKARVNGKTVAPAGRKWGNWEGESTLIPQVVVDRWARWVALNASGDSAVHYKAAISVLVNCCGDVGVQLPVNWKKGCLPQCFWTRLATPRGKNGYGYPCIRLCHPTIYV